MSRSLLSELTNVLADEICFYIDFITNPTGAQISVLQSKWDDSDVKLPPATSVYRQADTIDSNGPLGDQQRSQTLGKPKRKECKVSSLFNRMHNPNAVYVAGYQMPAQAIREPQRTFEIQECAGFGGS
jgi:hypothetical protein